ncbi:hypothetical protein [Kitasatospora sp. NPDC001683]
MDHTFAVTAGTECSRHSDGTPVERGGEPADLPTITAPTQLRTH